MAGVSFAHVLDADAMRSAIRTDEKRLRKVMDVFIGNALKHTPHGGNVVVFVSLGLLKQANADRTKVLHLH